MVGYDGRRTVTNSDPQTQFPGIGQQTQQARKVGGAGSMGGAEKVGGATNLTHQQLQQMLYGTQSANSNFVTYANFSYVVQSSIGCYS